MFRWTDPQPMPASRRYVRRAAARVDLTGRAFDRGLAQVQQCPDGAAVVRDAVSRRLAPVRNALAALAGPAVADFLARQWNFTIKLMGAVLSIAPSASTVRVI